ncbi:hypothetical protein HZB06_01335 [Candidatus Wolfebacteria bacterium]|nr:hypothetical protein [Candidatus Wolfebacteria bacterium]
MTIIQPNRNNYKFNLLISSFVIAIVMSAVWGVFIYNGSVNLRHETERHEIDIRQIEVENAELKNKFYSIIDAKNLEAIAGQTSLILDKNPQYVKEEQVAISN